MRRKNWLLAVLCTALVASTATGCTSTGDAGNQKTVTSADDADKQEADEQKAATSIQEQVLVDQQGIVITATEYVTDSIWGDGIKVQVENNSANDVTVGCNALIVNDYMLTDLFSATVAAGKKSNETIYLSSSQLEAAGIENVGKVEIYFHVFDSATYNTLFDTEAAVIETSEFANMDVTAEDTGVELYNAGGIRIVGKTVDENSFWGTAILLYCENTSGRNVGISVDDMSVNGFMMSPMFATTVYNEKKCIDEITIFENDLETNGITSIEEVELKFHIYDADSYETLADSDAITFKAQ